MENQSAMAAGAGDDNPHASLINTFCEITACPSNSDALFFLESHNFDLDAAVSTFLDNAAVNQSPPQPSNPPSQSASPSPRSRSPSPPPASRSYNLRSVSSNPNPIPNPNPGRRRRTAVATFSDLNASPKDDDSDSDTDPDFDPQEYYTGGHNSGMLVQDPSKANDVDTIFDQARQAGGVEPSAEHLPSSSSRSFTGTGRLLSGDVVSTPTPQPPETITHNITFWRNGFTVDDGPLRGLDDPQNASFLESIKKSECPRELAPADRRTAVHVHLMRKVEDYKEPKKVQLSFQGTGRTLGSSTSSETASEETGSKVTATLTTESVGVVVDPDQPSTSIQVRLADGSRMVSRFNNQHRISDIHRFIDASRGAAGRYELQSMGFPPKKLKDVDQTIEEAGIGNSVVIQKLLT